MASQVQAAESSQALGTTPIQIAAVVRQVRGTARAIYSVDDYQHFVTIQTTVRDIASSYPSILLRPRVLCRTEASRAAR